jgi:hypothetical protein
MPNPFGLAAGSTPPAGQATYLVAFDTVPNPHPSFHKYHGLWEPTFGLCQVTAVTNPFADDRYGLSSLKVYGKIKNQLISVYGVPLDLEFMDPDGTFQNADDFATSILYDERSHVSVWDVEKGAKLDSGIQRIILQVAPEGGSDLSVQLTYVFKTLDSGQEDQTGVDSL